MKTKAEIVHDWLPRYTGRPLNAFGKYILLTNFVHYVELFAERFGVEVLGRDKPVQSATGENITIMNFGMGSAMAATVMDLLSAVDPKAVLFLGKCGGLKKTTIGEFILPIAAIRGEGTSNDYLPPEIPALPSFRLQAAVSATIFLVGFANHIPKGALLLVSDNPMTPEGVKTSRSDVLVTEKFVRTHLEIGIDSLIELRDSGESV